MDTHNMTKRLQVLFEDGEYAALQAAAASRGMTVAEWVRQALAEARRDASTADVDRKLAAIREAREQEKLDIISVSKIDEKAYGLEGTFSFLAELTLTPEF